MSGHHPHPHAHPHPHPHPHGENPHAGQGAVMLDIGGDIGALVVVAPASMLGEEVEILDRRLPADQARAHVAVVERPVAGGRVASLVYPDLPEGDYDLVEKGGDVVRLTVQVHGGRVTEAAWPS